jgi:hypothetical protein
MSSYNEFKSDAKQFAVSYGLASIIVWLFNVLVITLTLGMFWLFSKNKENKIKNENWNKI